MGIVGGAVAGLVGALFGGSKYQVYGPTAAFIPVIAAITAKYEGDRLSDLVLARGGRGALMIMGLTRLGRLVAKVPDSIVVGFTIGIAVVIATSQAEQVFGLQAKLGYGFFDKVRGIFAHSRTKINGYAIVIAAITFCRDEVPAEDFEVHSGAADRGGLGDAAGGDALVGRRPERW